jgi:hypothetical protein
MKNYMHSEIEMKNLLQEVTEAVDNEREEEEDGIQDDWMIAGDGDQAWVGGPVDVVVTENFDWASRRNEYTQEQLDLAPKFVAENMASGLWNPPAKGPVTFDQLNEKQRIFYKIVEEAKTSGEQLLILLLGTAGVGKSHAVKSLGSIYTEIGSLLRSCKGCVPHPRHDESFALHSTSERCVHEAGRERPPRKAGRVPRRLVYCSRRVRMYLSRNARMDR